MDYLPVFVDVETTGLNPMAQGWWNNDNPAARVTAIAIGVSNIDYPGVRNDEMITSVEVEMDGSEYKLLESAAETMSSIVDDYESRGCTPFLVTFNGRQFDHPYLGARYSRYRLDGDSFIHSLKRLDMMRALGKHFEPVGRYPSEDDCVEVLGLEDRDPYDGSDMPDAWERGDTGTIRHHVVSDVQQMGKIFALTEDMCWKEFYDHYDIEGKFDTTEEVSLK